MSYYSDLSGNSSDGGSSESETSVQESSESQFHRKPSDLKKEQTWPQEETDSQLSSCVLHLDLDCFYCACEQIDRNLDEARPVAIGQKHIIVTSNYAARRHGVKKLQSREGAYQACPSLLIVEGSDLERYRRHARNVYEVFRKCIQLECYQQFIQSANPEDSNRPILPVCRGRGMDEMQADISCLVNFLEKLFDSPGDKSDIFIYGEGNQTTTLTEDQTGQEATVKPYQRVSREHDNAEYAPRATCQRRLLLAAHKLGRFIQSQIFEKTGFTTTIGVSVNPLLAKVASDLQKPMSVNVLYPWRAMELMESMPLRKIPDAGRRTIQFLTPALENLHGRRSADSFWTCRDLLALPKQEVQRCLGSLSGDICDTVIQRCRGYDTTSIVDDQGGAPKTISVENSFRRSTVLTAEAVWKGLEDLYIRLPRLLKDRREWSRNPEHAYPTTIRLTARTVDRSLLADKKRRRPFVTKSKQTPFTGGKALIDESNAEKQQSIVRKAVAPLVHSLVLSNVRDLNVTRLNIAVTNFKDVSELDCSSKKYSSATPVLKGTTQPFFPMESQSSKPCSQFFNADALLFNANQKLDSPPSAPTRKRNNSPPSSTKVAVTQVSTKRLKTSPATTDRPRNVPNGVDPAVLAELPPDMVKEVLQDYKQVLESKNGNGKAIRPNKSKPARIDHFFSRK